MCRALGLRKLSEGEAEKISEEREVNASRGPRADCEHAEITRREGQEGDTTVPRWGWGAQ